MVKNKFALLIILVLACKTPQSHSDKTSGEMNSNKAANNIIAKMSVRERVGQLFIIGFDGIIMNERLDQWIFKRNLGGIIIFEKNIKDETQLKSLCDSIQNLAYKTKFRIPLFIATDHEPGSVMRIKFRNTFPNARWINENGNEEYVRNMAKKMAEDLKYFGLNMNLAPVLDVDPPNRKSPIGNRTFGNDPKRVARLGSIFIKELQKNGIIATAKHFPGHGSARIDSHKKLPIVDKTYVKLKQRDLIPFKEAIKVGVDAIMVAHILYPKLDSLYPATSSKKILQEILRNKLGFKGIIITDDLLMRAITKHFDLRKISISSINSGADILLICQSIKDFPTAEDLYEVIVKAVEKGEIPEDILNQAVKRILILKMNRLHWNPTQ